MFIFQAGNGGWAGTTLEVLGGIGTAWLWSKSRYRIKPVHPGAPSEDPLCDPTLDGYEPYAPRLSLLAP